MSEEQTKSLEERFPSNNYTQIKPREELIKKDDKQPEGKQKRKIRAKEQKKSFGERIADNFLNMDHEQIRDRLLFDWLFPEIIATIDDILRMIFFGDRNGGGGRRRRDRDSRGYTSYNSIYDERRREKERDMPDPTRQNFKRIRLEYFSREDAEDVLDEIRECLAESSTGWVTVKELYSCSDLPTNSTMWKWGWNDLEDCMITRKGDLYVLEMPRAEVIR